MATLKTYKSGLRLIHEYDNSTRGVSINFYCLVGGKNEDNSNRGIAHLAEHMFFKGTNKRTSREINLELDKRGVITNASTSNDLTHYFAEGMDEHAEAVFDVFSDCLFNSQYPTEELEKERNVVCSELEMYENDFRDKVFSLGEIISLQGTGYAYTLGGTVESVSKITTQDLLNFRNRFYTPDRIIISVCGNITIEDTINLVAKYVEPYCVGEREPITYCQPIQDIDIKERLNFSSKETDQVYAMINFRSINKSAPDITAYSLAKIALGSTMTSRLFIKLRAEHGLVYAIYTYACLYGECGMNSIHFISSIQNSKKAFELVKETVALALKEGFTQEELDTCKNIAKTSLAFSNQTITGKANSNTKYYIYNNKLFDVSKEIQNIDKVTLEEMNEAFNKYYDFDYLTVSMVSKENNLDVLKLLGK